MTSINRIIVQFLLEIDTFLFEFHVEFTLHRWELKLIRRIIYNTKSDICLVVSDMKYPDRRNDMRFTQRLRIIPVSDSGATNFKYRLCRKTVHFPTVMPQSSVRRVLHLQIFHKNNKLQSFFHYGIRDSFLREKAHFETKYVHSFTQFFLMVTAEPFPINSTFSIFRSMHYKLTAFSFNLTQYFCFLKPSSWSKVTFLLIIGTVKCTEQIYHNFKTKTYWSKEES